MTCSRMSEDLSVLLLLIASTNRSRLLCTLLCSSTSDRWIYRKCLCMVEIEYLISIEKVTLYKLILRVRLIRSTGRTAQYSREQYRTSG